MDGLNIGREREGWGEGETNLVSAGPSLGKFVRVSADCRFAGVDMLIDAVGIVDVGSVDGRSCRSHSRQRSRRQIAKSPPRCLRSSQLPHDCRARRIARPSSAKAHGRIGPVTLSMTTEAAHRGRRTVRQAASGIFVPLSERGTEASKPPQFSNTALAPLSIRADLSCSK